MKTISTIGLDLAKNIFRVYGVNANGRCVVSKNIHRDSLAEFFAKLGITEKDVRKALSANRGIDEQ